MSFEYNNIKTMEQERIMLQRAASGKIFMGGLFSSQKTPPIPPPPPPIVAAAVQTSASAKGRDSAYRLRKRQARAGQSTLSSGGYSSGGATPGQTLMGG
jgi:hypothetical protein